MAYYKDLLKGMKRSKWGAAFGVFAVLYGIASSIMYFRNGESITYLVIGCIIYTLLGFMFILQFGFGININALLGGKAFIEINDKSINIKKEAFSKGQNIEWTEIKSIEYKTGNALVYIIKKDGSTCKISLSLFDYQTIQEVKSAIAEGAAAHQIPFNILHPAHSASPNSFGVL